jgi:hypothetical protein
LWVAPDVPKATYTATTAINQQTSFQPHLNVAIWSGGNGCDADQHDGSLRCDMGPAYDWIPLDSYFLNTQWAGYNTPTAATDMVSIYPQGIWAGSMSDPFYVHWVSADLCGK